MYTLFEAIVWEDQNVFKGCPIALAL